MFDFTTLTKESPAIFLPQAIFALTILVCGIKRDAAYREGYVTSDDFIGDENQAKDRFKHYGLMLRYIILYYLQNHKAEKAVYCGEKIFLTDEKVLGPFFFGKFLIGKPEPKKIDVMLLISHELASFLRPYALCASFVHVFGGIILYDKGDGTGLAACDGEVGLVDPTTIKPTSESIHELCTFYSNANAIASPHDIKQCVGHCRRWFSNLLPPGRCGYCAAKKGFDELSEHLSVDDYTVSNPSSPQNHQGDSSPTASPSTDDVTVNNNDSDGLSETKDDATSHNMDEELPSTGSGDDASANGDGSDQKSTAQDAAMLQRCYNCKESLGQCICEPGATAPTSSYTTATKQLPSS